jgi:hypothetical protein
MHEVKFATSAYFDEGKRPQKSYSCSEEKRIPVAFIIKLKEPMGIVRCHLHGTFCWVIMVIIGCLSSSLEYLFENVVVVKEGK